MDPHILQLKAEIRELQARVAELERAQHRWHSIALVALLASLLAAAWGGWLALR